MALNIYAGNPLVQLPSPTEINKSEELIWSENTGRAQSGANKAKMIGDVVAQKQTFEIKWGVLTATQYNSIKTHLPAGFFPFGVGTSPVTLGTFYRSEIKGNTIQAGGDWYYKDVTVSVIEQ